MSKTWVVAKREYTQRVKRKGFVIFTVLVPLLTVGYIFFIVKIGQNGANQANRLAVVDLSGRLLPALRKQMNDRLSDGKPKYTLTPVAATPENLAGVEAGLNAQVLSDRYTGYLVIPADVLESRAADFYAKNGVMQQGEIQAKLQQAVNEERLSEAGVALGQIPGFFSGFNLRGIKVSAHGQSADHGQTLVLGYILMLLIYGALIGYGTNFMMSVVEEKTSRVAEVILSATSAFDLLLGKILGVGGAALTQSAIWGAGMAILGAYSAAAAEIGGVSLRQYVPHIGPIVYVSFVVLFVLGFLVYASLYAAVGAVVSSSDEARQSALPITLLLVATIFLGFGVVAINPSSVSSVVLSLIPFFAPVLMMMRIAMATPPLWEVLLSFALCAATVPLIAAITAKLYRVGILMTGKRPNLPELMRWLRYS